MTTKKIHPRYIFVCSVILLTASVASPGHALTQNNKLISSSTYALAHTAHLKVKNVKGVPGDSFITVSWTAPTYVSKYPILGYTVWANYKSPTTGKRISTPSVETIDGLQTSVELSNLRNGLAYDFTIVARNAKEWSAINTNFVVRPSTRPDVPQIIRVVAGRSKVTIYWHRTFNGGSTQKFIVTTFRDGVNVGIKNNIYDNRTYPSAVISGLASGANYAFTVTAVNSNGAVESGSSVSIPILK